MTDSIYDHFAMPRRCFIAVPLPQPLRSTLSATSARLAPELPDIRWQRKIENLHLTLQFLGSVPDERVEALIRTLPARLADIQPFDIDVRGLGAFPSARRANVVWAGVTDPTASLAEIAARTQSEGDPREAGRPFRAHVTLGRSKTGTDVRAATARLADAAFGRVAVREVHLYESHLSRAGSTYVVLARAILGLGSG